MAEVDAQVDARQASTVMVSPPGTAIVQMRIQVQTPGYIARMMVAVLSCQVDPASNVAV